MTTESVRRWDYTGEGLDESQLPDAPWLLARAWVDQAVERADEDAAMHEPTSIAVATVDADGRPDVREVLMRFLTPAGPGFVSHRVSGKGGQLAANPGIAASLTWTPMFRAIRFRGTVEEIPQEEVDAYFRSRPWGSRISAWASDQSHPCDGRAYLQEKYDEYAARWPDTGSPDDVPVPEDWVGWRVRCDTVEFWAGRSNRLHDRIRYVRTGGGDLADAPSWEWRRLQP